MNKISHTTMRESTLLRWTALILVSATMFFGYMFVDVLSPLQTLLQQQKGWTPEVYGTFASSEYFLNVFVLFLQVLFLIRWGFALLDFSLVR